MLGADIKPAIRSGSLAIGQEVRAELARYPGGVAAPVAWVSARQRRAYFAMRRKAGLGPRYVRNSDPMSQRLGPSWTVEPKGDMGAVVGTRATYAPWVQSKARQQPMHRATGWSTDEQAVNRVVASGRVNSIMAAAIGHALGGT
jgi:hypothetical protein